MVEESRMHLQEGHLSIMWKDITFNYSYFLWFEDNSVCDFKKGNAYICMLFISYKLMYNNYTLCYT